MSTANNTENTVSEQKILRLLSGNLKGCEFFVDTARILVIFSAPQTAEMMALNELPPDTLVLPGGDHNFNCEMEFDENDKEHFIIRDLSETPPAEQEVAYNTPVVLRDNVFAVKRHEQAWSSTVLGKVAPQGQVKKQAVKWLVLTVLALLLLATGYYTFHTEPDPASQNILALQKMLTDTRDLTLVSGHDNVVYILTKNQRMYHWVSQFLARNPVSYNVKVVYPEKEVRRIYEWLARNYPDLKYFRIAFDDTIRPAFILSKQRASLSIEQQNVLRQDLLKLIPYASDIIIIFADDNSISEQAEQGLGSLNVQYTKHKLNDHISYNIAGELTDGELVRLQSFIDEFYVQWGEQYITFNISLTDDNLKDKSFSYGRYNYIKNAPGKWFFISPSNN